MIRVFSTGHGADTKRLCKASVRRQDHPSFQHHYIEAKPSAIQDGDIPGAGYTQIQNLCRASMLMPTNMEDITVLLDGDDWLPHERVLSTVQSMHDQGAWVTYGSFETPDGKRTVCPPYKTDFPRTEPWYASHLKTFRAGLWHYINVNRSFSDDRIGFPSSGTWLTGAYDQMIMFPLLEMVGRDRTTASSEILCVYNLGNSFEAHASSEEMAHERRMAKVIREKAPYERL